MLDLPYFLAALDPQLVEQWLQAGGYLMLFGVLFACGLGLPLPEDVPLIAAGALIATGKMHPVHACTVAWLGIMGGDLMLYHIGKRFGPNITRVPFIGSHINTNRLAKVEVWFAKYGVWVVAVGRMFAGIRGAMVVTAGTIRFNLIKFLIADGLAAIVSGGLFVLLGYWLGNNLPELMKKVDKGKGIFLILSLAVLAGLGLWWWLSHRRKAARELSAIPTTESARSPAAAPSDAKA